MPSQYEVFRGVCRIDPLKLSRVFCEMKNDLVIIKNVFVFETKEGNTFFSYKR